MLLKNKIILYLIKIENYALNAQSFDRRFNFISNHLYNDIIIMVDSCIFSIYFARFRMDFTLDSAFKKRFNLNISLALALATLSFERGLVDS